VRAHMMSDEITHVLPIGFLHAWSLTGAAPDQLYMLCAEENGEVAAVVMRINGFRAIVSCSRSLDAVRALAEQMHVDEPDTPGALGAASEAQAFVERWSAVSGSGYKINRAERIYRLEKVIPVTGVSGHYHPATMDDLDLLTKWLHDFEIEVDPMVAITPIERYRQGVLSRLESDPRASGYWVWENNRQCVSMVGYTGTTPNGIRVGPVYTPPVQRGHGYASALTAAVTQYCLDQGRKFVALYTDLANPTSNKIYQAIGYQPVTDVDEYVFTRVNS